MHLQSCEEVYLIYNEAIEIREKTPYSFRILANNLEIFKPNSTNLKMLYHKYNLENLILLPIFPSEVFSITYENIVNCSDERCEQFQKGILENKLQIYHQVEKMNVDIIFPVIEIIGIAS